MYRQALVTLDDTEMAEQVVSDVSVQECVRPAAISAGRDPGPLVVDASDLRRIQATAGRSPAVSPA